MSEEVFMLRGDALSGIPLREFRKGFRNERLEAALQALLERHPDLIPGSQISTDGEPPRFALIERESAISGRWSADHVFIDQFGVPTLVETKLFENPESRRDVIGQVLEYAANALNEWGRGGLRRRGESYWAGKGRQLDELLADRFAIQPEEVEQLWAIVEGNLEENRIRLIIAGDSIRPEIRRIVEFLNEELRNVELLALEVRVYAGDEADPAIFVSHIIGQTQRAADRKNRTATVWTFERLEEEFVSELEQDHPLWASRLRTLMKAMVEAGVFREPSRAKTPTFSAAAPNGARLMSIQGGIPHWTFRDDYYGFEGGVALRDRMKDALHRIGMVPAQLTNGTSMNLQRGIEELSEEEFAHFTRVATYQV